VRSLSNIILHRNPLLLFVGHLATRVLTRKFRISNTATGNKITRGTKCLFVTSARRATNSPCYVRTDFKQCVSCNNAIELQEFDISFGFVVLYLKRFMCRRQNCDRHGTFRGCRYSFTWIPQEWPCFTVTIGIVRMTKRDSTDAVQHRCAELGFSATISLI
jgi:hypothetical protein